MPSVVYSFLKESFSESRNRKRFRRMNLSISTLVFVNVILLMLATVKSLPITALSIIKHTNQVITFVFAIEYFVRFKFTNKKKTQYLFSFVSIVDIIAIFPALIAMLVGVDMTHVTFLRLLRVFKFFRTSKSIKLFQQVMKRTYRQLAFSFSLIAIVILIFSSVLHLVESHTHPQAFSNIFDCMWWVISALTTSGYISVYPTSLIGKVISSLIVIIGISLFAIPAGIITAGFIEEYKTVRSRRYNQVEDSDPKK